MIDIICPNRDPDIPFVRKTIGLDDKDVFFTDKKFTDLIEQFKNCPHPLAEKTLKFSFLGPNPYTFTDFNRNVIYDDNGRPLGSNAGISTMLAKMFGFEYEVFFTGSANYYDNKTGTWIGLTGNVSIRKTPFYFTTFFKEPEYYITKIKTKQCR